MQPQIFHRSPLLVEPLVEIDAVSMRFGGIQALDKVSFTIGEGQIVGLIGPNGAGKTTLFNCLSLLYRPTSGDIRVGGVSILESQPHQIAALGLGRTFQNVALFDSMTVLDNTVIGGHCRAYPGVLREALGLPSVIASEQKVLERARELIDLLQLTAVADKLVSELNFAARKKVEIARALASSPRLLMLDEPAGGLSHEEVEDLAHLIRSVRDQRKTGILLVEHHMNLVMQVSDKVVALDFGQKIADGLPRDVQSDDRVLTAYMGVDA